MAIRNVLLISAILFLSSSCLWSAAIYSYDSPTFCSGPAGGVTPGYGLTCSDFVSASVTYNSVLQAGLTDDTSNASLTPDLPVSWSFSDGVEDWTPANSFFSLAQVNTDSNGDIDGWTFTLYMGSFSGHQVYLVSSTPEAYAQAGVFLTPGLLTAVVDYDSAGVFGDHGRGRVPVRRSQRRSPWRLSRFSP